MKIPHKHAEVIKAWADGAEIQFRNCHYEEWRDLKKISPVWIDFVEYRIKPEPKPDVVFYSVASVNDAVIANIEHIGMFNNHPRNNLRLTFDSETGKLKSAEVLK